MKNGLYLFILITTSPLGFTIDNEEPLPDDFIGVKFFLDSI
jgi:hypothetical protein